jgi:medium-chain acyl-[acyl-carrier-protein] hydrolase
MDDTLTTAARPLRGASHAAPPANPRVYCVPHAGGSASVFAELRQALRPEFEVVSLEPAGHGRRMMEPLPDSVADSADDLYRTLRDALRPQDVLLGHSLGGWIAYEVAVRCQCYGTTRPRLLVCSGSAPPPPAPAVRGLSTLPEPEFLAAVGAFGRLPSRVFDDPNLRRIYLPILRKDYQLVDEYHSAPRPVDCDVLVLRGSTDALTAPGTGDWSLFTRRAHHVQDFDGGHFFLYEQAYAAAQSIKRHYAHSTPSGLA